MAWITSIQADAFLKPNADWDAVTNKDEVLKLSTNRLEQLTFKGEPIDRVGARYIDGESVSTISGSANFLLEAEAGNFAYHALLGWTRGNSLNDLVIYVDTGTNEPNVVFDNPHDEGRSGQFNYQQILTLKQIQSLHTFGGTFGGIIALNAISGKSGVFTAIETKQANAIVDKDGEQVFLSGSNRRIQARFGHDDTYCYKFIEGTNNKEFTFNGTDVAEVIDEQGDTQFNTVPTILAGEYIDYEVKVVNGMDKPMFLTVNGILLGNPTFHASGQNFNRLQYSSGTSGSSTNRHTYIRQFGSIINTEVPITIPVRLVGACALLALEYSKFPPKFVGEQAYLENENDYNRMQDLPINVQAAVEPFLADYLSVVDEKGVATTEPRSELPPEDRKTSKDLEYKDE